MSKKKNRATRHKKRDKTHKIKSHGQKFNVEVVDEPALVAYDESLLERARTQWQFGDWERLVQLDQKTLQHHPQRSKLALLVAAGHFQLGNQQTAHQFIRLAEDWGCGRKLVAQMLISGTYNSLGCAAVLIDQHPRALEHFGSAVKLGGIPGDTDLLTNARAVKQCSIVVDNI